MTEEFKKQIETEARQAVTELLAQAKLKKGDVFGRAGLRREGERLHNRRLQHGPGPEHYARFPKGVCFLLRQAREFLL